MIALETRKSSLQEKRQSEIRSCPQCHLEISNPFIERCPRCFTSVARLQFDCTGCALNVMCSVMEE